MAEQLLDKIVKIEIVDGDFHKWFLDQFATVTNRQNYCLDEFGVIFLNFIHKQTEEILETINGARANIQNVSINLNESLMTASTSCQNVSSYLDKSLSANGTVNLDDSFALKSTSTVRKKTNQPTKCFEEKTFSPPVNENFENRFLNKTSTPIKNQKKISGHRPSTSICLGDFISTTRGKQKQTKNQKLSASCASEASKSTNTRKLRVKPLTISKSVGDGFYNPVFYEDKANSSNKKMEVKRKSKSPKTPQPLEIKNNTTKLNQTLVKTNESNSKFDLTKVTNREIIDRFVTIYTVLIDLNVVTNLLNEMSFLFNIINCGCNDSSIVSVCEQIRDLKLESTEDNVIIKDKNTILESQSNCIYFAVNALSKQKHMLALLDLQTLRVILNFPRMSELAKDLTQFLTEVYERKTNLQNTKSKHEASFPVGNSFSNVSYQEENDTLQHFPTNKEFGTFKKQRDLFYDVLKTWDTNQLDPREDFEKDLSKKIRYLFEVSQDPINMAHLSRLFVSQLIISSNFVEKPSDLGLETNLDIPKLTKLQERLVSIGNFSTNYQFPGQQMFFKKFLLIANSVTFSEQIKMAFMAELIEYNESTFEIINIVDKTNDPEITKEYIVRPEIITNMKILAKFLGFITTQPFEYDHKKSGPVDKKQIELRNLLTPNFDIITILKKSIMEQKLLITIPWLVQYVVMLDYITLQLDYYENLMQLLYEVYSNIGMASHSGYFIMRPSSVFILKTSLGWLFDNANISSNYYNYRISRNQLSSILSIEMKPLSVLLPKSKSGPYIEAKDQFVITDVKEKQHGQFRCTLINSNTYSKDIIEHQEIDSLNLLTFDPLLEKVVNAACPFLAEFRVAIMQPNNISKSVSRSGTLRHVTTRVSNIQENPSNPDADIKKKLIDAFLHSQSLSVRRIIEFVIERTTSAAVKDFQMEYLLPSKCDANEKIEMIVANDLSEFTDAINSIHDETFQLMITNFETLIPQMIESRAQKSLDGLLPNETHPMVKQTCLSLILQKCTSKIDEWRYANIKDPNFYAGTSSVAVIASKLMKSRSVQAYSTALEIKRDDISVSNMITELQYMLHSTNFKPELVSATNVEEFLINCLDCLTGNSLPHSFFRVIGVMSINLIQNLIQNHSEVVDINIIQRFINIWLHNGLKPFIEISESSYSDPNLNIFNALITPAFIRSLGIKKLAYDRLGLLLINLVKKKLLNYDFINELVLCLYKFNLPEFALKEISNVLDKVLRESKPPNHEFGNDGRERAVMEVLANLVRDIDDY